MYMNSFCLKDLNVQYLDNLVLREVKWFAIIQRWCSKMKNRWWNMFSSQWKIILWFKWCWGSDWEFVLCCFWKKYIECSKIWGEEYRTALPLPMWEGYSKIQEFVPAVTKIWAASTMLNADIWLSAKSAKRSQEVFASYVNQKMENGLKCSCVDFWIWIFEIYSLWKGGKREGEGVMKKSGVEKSL